MATEKKVLLGIQADTAGAKKMVAALTQVRASMEDLSSSAEANMQILSSNMTTTWTKGGKEINKFTNIVQDNLGNTFRQVTKSVAGETPELMSQSFKQISKSAYAELSATSQQFKNFGNIAAQSNEDILKSAGFFGKSIRNDIGKPVALVSSEVENHLTAQGDAVRRVSAVWKDEFGKTVNTVYQQSASGTKAISAGFVKVKEAVSNIPTGPVSQMGDSMQRLQFAVKGVGNVSAESFQLIRGNLQTTGKGVELFTETFTNKLGQKVVITSQKTAQGLVPISKNIDTIGKSAEKSFQRMNDFQKALARVAVVVPIWMAARAAMQSVFATIRGGVEYIADLEAGMARAAVMSADLTDATIQLNQVQKQTESLVLETGKKFTEVVEAYTLLKTAGVDFTTSLQAQSLVTKTAVGLMGDIPEIAGFAADAYNVMGSTIKGAATGYQRMAIILGTGSALFQSNAFEINQFAEAMRKSIGVANSAGVAYQELAGMVGALAQVGIRGGEAGTVVNRIIRRLGRDKDLLQSIIGPDVDLSSLSTIKLFENTFESLFTTIESGGRGRAFNAAVELLGEKGIKGLAISSAGGLDAMHKAMEKTASMNFPTALKLINDNYKIQIDHLKVAQERAKRLQEILGATFLKGITGTSKLKDAYTELGNVLEDLQGVAGALGSAIGVALTPMKDLAGLLQEIRQLQSAIPTRETFLSGLIGKEDANLVDKFFQQIDKVRSSATKQLLKLITSVDLDILKDTIKILKDVRVQIDRTWHGSTKRSLGLLAIAQEVAMSAAAINATKGIKGDVGGSIIPEEDTDETKESAKDTVSSLQKMVEHRIKLLQLQGATTAEQLKAQAALEKSLFGQTRIQTLLDQQLETERKINEQKKEQYGYSSDSLKLMEISQTYGLKVAEEIGKVLQTGATPADLSTGARRVYESQFADKYQQYKAEEFFTRGAGRGINIEERGLAGTGQVLTHDTSGALTAQTARGVINAPISMPVSIQVNTDAVIGKVEQSILKEIRNPNSELAKQLKEFNEKYL